ncbi:MAG: type II toxin-antitoxin system Phd/YefM family antitoxin [Rhodospirillales bacterium]|nr:type II toxin-antitoxin system Phd/YefM family antitoxin [Rhodospirillales bacterium]
MMKRLPATYAARNFGTVLRDALADPVFVTTHGRDAVVILAADTYKKLVAQTEPKPPRQENVRISDPWRIAVSVVNTSRSTRDDRESLIQALLNPGKANKALLRIFFSDVDEKTMAAIARAGPVDWAVLAEACEFVGDVDHEKATFIRDMALLTMGRPA